MARRAKSHVHGTATCYTYGCRCDACTRAHARAKAESLARFRGDPNDARHGTYTGAITYGCRCAACERAMVDNPEWSAKKSLKRRLGL